jgi:hypothetical protein
MNRIFPRLAGAAGTGLGACLLNVANVGLQVTNDQPSTLGTWATIGCTVVTLWLVAGCNISHAGVAWQLFMKRRRVLSSAESPFDDFLRVDGIMMREALQAMIYPLVLENVGFWALLTAALATPGAHASAAACIGAGCFALAAASMALIRRGHPHVRSGGEWLQALPLRRYRGSDVIELGDGFLPGLKEASAAPVPGQVGPYGRRVTYCTVVFAVAICTVTSSTPETTVSLKQTSAALTRTADPLPPDLAGVVGTPLPGQTYQDFCGVYPWTAEPPAVAGRLAALWVVPEPDPSAESPGGAGAAQGGCGSAPVTFQTTDGQVTYEVGWLDHRVRSVALVTSDGDAMLYAGAARIALPLLQRQVYLSASTRRDVLSGDLYVLQIAGQGTVILVRASKTDQEGSAPYVEVDCAQTVAWTQLMAQRQAWLWPVPDTSRTTNGIALHSPADGGIVATIDDKGQGKAQFTAGGASGPVMCRAIDVNVLLRAGHVEGQ